MYKRNPCYLLRRGAERKEEILRGELHLSTSGCSLKAQGTEESICVSKAVKDTKLQVVVGFSGSLAVF